MTTDSTGRPDAPGDAGQRAPAKFDLRPAAREDLAVVHAMIRGLADYEKLTHLCVVTEVDLAEALFGPRPVAEVLIAWQDGVAAGFALFFHNFSTFLGRPGIWLEDLFVHPAYRRQGCGEALLRAVAAIAVARRCGRFEWSVLDWNAPAIEFYRRLGATLLPDWRIARTVGPALTALAAAPPDDDTGR